MNDLTVFQFEGQQVRFVGTPEDPWWVAADVCAVLEIRNNRDAIARLDDDEKGVASIDTPGGSQEMTTINESGLYSLILTSRKPQAKRFKKWVTSEVLPSIRKTGKYEVDEPEATQITATTKNTPETPSIKDISDLFDLTLTDIHPNIIAEIKLKTIAAYYPSLKGAADMASWTLKLQIGGELISPTEIAELLTKRTGFSWSARAVNKAFINQGFQIKNPAGNNPAYLPTEKGKRYSRTITAANRSGATIKVLRWYRDVITVIDFGRL